MLTARNDAAASGGSSTAVDWWFAYKMPKRPDKAPGAKSTPDLAGFNYVYADAAAGGLGLSPHKLGDPGCALDATLDSIFAAAAADGSTAGWIAYNDEIPNSKKNDERKGHCKGVLAFDKASDSAVWLLHSTPRYPVIGEHDFPEDEEIYAQTYLCVTLSGYEAANAIAAVLRRQHDPQVYATQLPKSLSEGSPDDEVVQLAKGTPIDVSPDPADIPFASKGGQPFRLLAKSREWGKDFWIDWVGPSLKADFQIETWRRGKIPGTEDSDNKDWVADVDGIDLTSAGAPVEWHYTKDHAKWGVSVENDWVCVADINRQTSQEKRGGGSICMQHKELWAAMKAIETKVND